MMTLTKNNSPLSVSAPPGQGNEARREQRWLLIFAGLYMALYAGFYPQMYTSLDESANFGMAYVLRHGTIYPNHAGYTLALSPLGPHGLVYRFPIGFPVVLALLSFASWHTFFLINPILHLVATGLFAKLLQSQKIAIGWAILYLLYPGFVLYDRTLFSDPFAASLTTMAVYFLLGGRPRPAPAGLCMGLALLARSTSLVVTLILAASLVVSGLADAPGQYRSGSGSPLMFGLGLLPFIVINGVYNEYAMGRLFRSAYSVCYAVHRPHFVKFGPLYAASLLLLFPGMLLAPLFYRGRCRWQCLAATSTVVLIAAFYHESTFGGSTLQTFVSVSRQVLPALPFYLLAYCACSVRPAALCPGTERRAGPARSGFRTAADGGGNHAGGIRNICIPCETCKRRSRRRSRWEPCVSEQGRLQVYQPELAEGHLPGVTPMSARQADADLRLGRSIAVLFLRSRGVANEDAANADVKEYLTRQFIVVAGASVTRQAVDLLPDVLALRKDAGIAE